MKDFLVANGQLRVAKGVGNANIVLELARSHRKLKADGSFTVAAPTYNVVLTLYPDFEKDNNQKLVLSTHNQLKSNLVDSKTFIEYSGQKLEVNFKGSVDGKINDGKLLTEAEVILPNNLYFATKFNRELRIVNGIANGNVFLSLDQRDNKNTPGRKLTIKGVLKNANLQEELFETTYNIVLENGHGSNLNADLGLKRVPHGDHIAVDGNVRSLIQNFLLLLLLNI